MGGTRNILVVDDNLVFTGAIQRKLISAGLHVIEFNFPQDNKLYKELDRICVEQGPVHDVIFGDSATFGFKHMVENWAIFTTRHPKVKCVFVTQLKAYADHSQMIDDLMSPLHKAGVPIIYRGENIEQIMRLLSDAIFDPSL